MQRIAAALLALLTVAICFSKVRVSTEAKTPVSFIADTHAEGEEIQYRVLVSEDSGICGLTLRVEYAKEKLQLLSSEAGEMTESGILQINDSNAGKVITTFITTEPLSIGGEYLVLRFRVLDPKPKTLSVRCRITECIDYQCNDITYTLNTSVIENPIYEESTETEVTPDAEAAEGGGKQGETAPPETVPVSPETGGKAEPPETEDGNDRETEPGNTPENRPKAEAEDSWQLWAGWILLPVVGIVIVFFCVKRRKQNEKE